MIPAPNTVTANGGDYTVHVVVGMDPGGKLWVLDLWRGQAAADAWVEAFCDPVRQWRPKGSVMCSLTSLHLGRTQRGRQIDIVVFLVNLIQLVIL